MKNLKKAVLKAFKWILIGFAGIILLAGTLLTFLQTDFASQILNDTVNSLFLEQSGLKINISNIDGVVPFRFRIGKLVMSDKSGKWLFIEKASLDLSPVHLFRGKLSFKKLHVKRIKIDRTPLIKGYERESKPAGFEIPPAVSRITIDDLLISTFQLDKSIIGRPLELSIKGDFTDPGVNAARNLSFKAEDRDGFSASLAASVSAENDVPYMELKLSVKDPGKGILYHLSGRGEDFNLFLEGKGELSRWQGRLDVSSESEGEVASKVVIEADRGYKLNVDGQFSPAESLPVKKYRNLIEKNIEFSLQASVTEDMEIYLKLLEVDTGKSEAGFRGSILLSNLDSVGDFNLAVEDLSALEGVLNEPVSGSLNVNGTVKGYLLEPEIEMSYRVNGFGSNMVEISKINGDGSAIFQHEKNSKGMVNISGSGDITGLRVELKDSAHDEEKVVYSFDITGSIKDGLDIKHLKIDSQSISGGVSGYVDISGKKISLEGALSSIDLSRILPKDQSPVSGSGEMDLSVDAELVPLAIDASIKGKYKPGKEEQFLKNLSQGNLHFSGRASFNDGKVNLSGVQIDAGESFMKGSGVYDLEGALNFKGNALLSDLGAFSRYTEKTLGGRANIEYSLKGKTDALEISSSLDIKNFIWGEFNSDTVTGRITDIREKESDRGEIAIEFTNEGYVINAGSDFLFSEKKINLKNVSLSGAGTQVSGNIDFYRNGNSITGKLAFNSDDISKIAGLFGQDLNGSTSGEFVFTPGQGGQNITFRTLANDLTFQQQVLDSMDMKGSLSDIFNEINFETQVSLKGYKYEEILLQEVDLNAGGSRERVAIHLKGSGSAVENLTFETTAGFENRPADKSVIFDDMQVIFGSTEVKLDRPMRITFSGGRILAENVDIKVGSGGINGSLNYNSDNMDGKFSVEKIPLDILALAGAPLLDGTVSGSLTLAGSPSLPDITGNMTIDGIRRRKLKKSDIPPVSLKGEYGISRESITGKLIFGNLTGNIRIPCDFSVYPFSFEPRSISPVSGNLKGDFDLVIIPAMFEIRDQVISGRLDTDFELGGTYNSPMVSGKARLSEGKYENPSMGLLFNNVEASIRAEKNRFIVNSLTANDGLNGSVTGSGGIDMDFKKDFPYEVDMSFRNMQLIKSNRLTAALDGKSRISGSLGKHEITGSLVLDRSEFKIPEKLPVEITELDVKEINRAGDAVSTDQKNDEAESESSVKLDISVSSTGRTYIKGRGLNSEWKGNLKLDGTAGEPVIDGKLALVRGSYSFLSQTFTLTSGSVRFYGNSPPEPTVDVTGKIVKSDITAFINLTGNITDPALNLRSEPPLPRDEILSRVLFDRDVSQITPLQALQLAAAVNELLRGSSGFNPLEYTRDLIGVDSLQVKPSEENGEGSAISAGKYLRDNIYLEVEKGIGGESGKASVTWELTPNITVDTEVGENSETEIGVNWKYDY